MLVAILIILFAFLLLFFYCACKVSGDISRIEEEMDKNKYKIK